jgi:hypothetical protein
MEGLVTRCGFDGIANLGCDPNKGSPCNVWVIGCRDYQTIAHELGHNLGLAHAKTFYQVIMNFKT